MYQYLWGAFVRFINSDEYGAIYGYPAQLFVPVAAILAVYGGLLVLLVVHVVKPPAERKITLLLGASGAGKTAIYHQLRDGQFVAPTTPTTEAYGGKFPMFEAYNTVHAKRFVKVFDLPGHARLRSRVTSHFATAGLVAFVVDAADASSFRKAAQFLLDVFSNETFQQVAPTMAIVCNKTDLPTAAGVEDVRRALENELTQLNSKTQSKGDGVRVGREDAAFAFGVDAPCPVRFLRCSAKQGELTELATFILTNY